ncbi:helix-turn-helix transcriptional regulator [Muricauda sp. MAR_2010_75]|uniref:helix-turn-helix transcriptional regulator n=1 Tax=Allomuricauda sp. MAR_2010_75 TaxID=1250232 RepID=UPI000563FBC9|nr:helix-turn-helix transcriptional regulator [Muricauda sp. MAR_2010_75]
MTGKEIREKRLAKGWSQEQLASLTGQTRETVNKHENGSKIPMSKQSAYKRAFHGLSMDHIKSNVKDVTQEYDAPTIILDDSLFERPEDVGRLIGFLFKNRDKMEKDVLGSRFLHEIRVEGEDKFISRLIDSAKKLNSEKADILKEIVLSNKITRD